MIRAALVALVAALTLAGCGEPGPTGGTGSPSGSSAPSPTATATATPTPTPLGVTDAQARAVVAATYPASGGTVSVCQSMVATTPPPSPCPFTQRLQAQLTAMYAQQQGPGADLVCGCQNNPESITVTVVSTGVSAVVKVGEVYSGTTQQTATLTIVNLGGVPLADDLSFSSCGDIYANPRTC